MKKIINQAPIGVSRFRKERPFEESPGERAGVGSKDVMLR